MYKIIFTDLDDTLLSDNKTISKKNIEAVKKCTDKGIKVLLASGRTPTAINEYIDILNLNDYYHICLNGIALYNKNKNDIKILNSINNEKLLKIINILKKMNCTYFVFDESYGLFESEELLNKTMEDDPRRNFPTKIVNFEDITNPLKLSCLFNNEEEYIALEKIAKEQDVSSCKVSKTCMNFMPKGVSKYSAILHIINSMNINPDDVAVIGDNDNDLEMIKNIKTSFAVKNAFDKVKENAFITLPFNNNEDAFYHMINDYLNI